MEAMAKLGHQSVSALFQESLLRAGQTEGL